MARGLTEQGLTQHDSRVPEEEPAMKTRHRNDGLTKNCGCGRRKWAKCSHPWTLAHYQKRCTCPRSCSCPGNRRRANLHKVAGKPATYWMSRTEAEQIAERLRTQ